MNGIKNTMLNVFIGGGIGVELMELSFDIGLFNEWMRGALMTLSVLAIFWKFYRQGMFKKKK